MAYRGRKCCGVAKRAGAGLQLPGRREWHRGAGCGKRIKRRGTVAAGTAGVDIAGAAGNSTGNIPAGAAEGMMQKVLDGITGGSVSAADLLRIASWVWLAGLATILYTACFAGCGSRRTVHMAVRLQDNVYECGNISSPLCPWGCLGQGFTFPFRLSERERELYYPP